MVEVLLEVLPLFFLVTLGFLFKSKFTYSDICIKYLTRFVMYVALPAVLLEKLGTTKINELIEFSFLFSYLISFFIVMLISVLFIYFVFSKDIKFSVMLGLGGVYGNIGFLAIPVLSLSLGEWVSVPLALMLTLDLLILLPVSTFLLKFNSNTEKSNMTLLKTLSRSFLNPLILSIVVAFILSIFQMTLPSNIIDGLSFLGSAAGPCAMFIVGTAIYGRKISSKPIAAAYISTVKLIVMPLVVYIFMNLLSVKSEWIIAATLGAAMPCAAVLSVIAEEHKTIPQQVSAAVLVTTIFSVFTVPFLIFIFS
ncbi:AEC family transporter [Marinomonas algicola]|uniref:AEC family transporter n=1 Tax=Marinomonas algicola TaxID=2773454 RepID=UPI00174A77F3|nr:AEC family transporter [Marinomonas algicola]